MLKQLAKENLGPKVLYVEPDRTSSYWGLMVMEELPEGGFSGEFCQQDMTEEFTKMLGELLGCLHRLPVNEVTKSAMLVKNLVKENLNDDLICTEKLYDIHGGHGLFLIYWWMNFFPQWVKQNRPENYPLPKEYCERFLKMILKVLRIVPRTKVLSKIGFSHSDLYFGNLMRKDGRIVAIDCETAILGPALLDFGAILWNPNVTRAKQPHIERSSRETLARSFYETLEEEFEKPEDVLYDLELGFLMRYLWIMLCEQFFIVSNPVEVGGLFMTKVEAMADGMIDASDDEEAIKKIAEVGIYWSINPNLPEDIQEKIEKLKKEF